MKNGLRAVVFKDGDKWVAQCLEHDIGAQGADLAEAEERLHATILAEIQFSVDRNEKPLSSIEAAPKRYHEMWERSRALASSIQDGAAKKKAALRPGIELALCA